MLLPLPLLSTHHYLSWYRNFDLLSIGYAFRPLLRIDLPRADEPAPGNLNQSARKIVTFKRYSRRHSCLYQLHLSSQSGFTVDITFVYHYIYAI